MTLYRIFHEISKTFFVITLLFQWVLRFSVIFFLVATRKYSVNRYLLLAFGVCQF